MNIHQPAELVQVAGFQRFLALAAQFFDEMKIVGHFLVALPASRVLIFQNGRCASD